MPTKLPKFRVRLVEQNSRCGFLLERRMNGTRERAYFFDSKSGLEPSPQITQVCNGRVYSVTREANQDSILEELKAYTKAAHESRDMREERPPIAANKYRRGYADVLGEFFRRGNQELRTFFGNMQLFRACVLEDARGGRSVIGRAVEFRVVSPESPFPEDDLAYLRNSYDFLEVGVKQEPVWFRKRGPVAKDFESGMVFRRSTLLDALREMVANHPVCLVEGNSATGKTVLVRHLAYELDRDEGLPVYYFRSRRFRPTTLLWEIDQVSGLVILEDIHLNCVGFQEVVSRLGADCRSRLLLTARPSFRVSQDRDWQSLDELPTQLIMPYDHVDEIVAHFVSNDLNRAVDWPVSALQQIQSVSDQNFWLLSYALTGYVESRGSGNGLHWLRKGVQRDLLRLGRVNSRYPEILIALSPLYQMEVPTAESYLTERLGFTVDDLNALVESGEIAITETAGDDPLYALPHASLAAAYWEHGALYRRRLGLKGWEDFIYEYAVSGTPNGLEAISSAQEEIRRSCLSRALREGRLSKMVECERSLPAITGLVCEEPSPPDDVITLVANRVSMHQDPAQVRQCIRGFGRSRPGVWKRFWAVTDKRALVNTLSTAADIGDVGTFVGSLVQIEPADAHDFCRLLTSEPFCANLAKAADVGDMLWVLTWISKANRAVGRQIVKRPEILARLAAEMGSRGGSEGKLVCDETQVLQALTEKLALAQGQGRILKSGVKQDLEQVVLLLADQASGCKACRFREF